MIFADWIVVWLAIAGGCALILGAHRVGIALVMPALFRFAFLPTLAPVLDQTSIATFIVLAPIVLVFGGILLLKLIIRPIYGETAGGYVAGSYLVRVFDSIGRAILAVINLPVRMLRRRGR